MERTVLAATLLAYLVVIVGTHAHWTRSALPPTISPDCEE
jgi:hypothetical protein